MSIRDHEKRAAERLILRLREIFRREFDLLVRGGGASCGPHPMDCLCTYCSWARRSVDEQEITADHNPADRYTPRTEDGIIIKGPPS